MLILAGIVVMQGDPDDNVSMSGVMELVGDAHRSAVKPAMVATRVSIAEEQEVGNRLANQMHFWSSNNDSEEFNLRQAYIEKVGNSLLKGLARPEIKYSFHLIDQSMVNAFAIPGHVYVFNGLIDFVESEAELAVILGHEIMHVDARHCIELFQAEMAAEKITGPILGNSKWISRIGMRIASRVIQGGYRKFQEFEADSGGLSMAVAAGYDPRAGETVMKRLGEKFGDKKPASKAKDPVEELRRAVFTAAGSFYSSHPPTHERAGRLHTIGNRLTIKGNAYYRGVENLKQLQTKQQMLLDSELVTY